MKIYAGQQIWLDPERTYIGYDVVDGKIVDVRHVDVEIGEHSIVLGTEEMLMHFSEHETTHKFVRLLFSDGSTSLLSRGVVETHGRVLTSSTTVCQ